MGSAGEVEYSCENKGRDLDGLMTDDEDGNYLDKYLETVRYRAAGSTKAVTLELRIRIVPLL